MARHEIVIHENTSATREAAPYLGSYIAKETLQMAAFADAVMASCQAIDANTLKIECDAGDAPAAGDYPDATLEIGMAHYVEGELVTETLIVPIHLVVNG